MCGLGVDFRVSVLGVHCYYFFFFVFFVSFMRLLCVLLFFSFFFLPVRPIERKIFFGVGYCWSFWS